PVSHLPKGAKKKQIVEFIPLDKDVRFVSKVNFHNLKTEELGALLSALTFHQTEECCHSMGMAKPQGYGKVKINVQSLSVDNGEDSSINNYLQAFEAFMQAELSAEYKDFKWINSSQLTNLAAMSQKHNEDNDDHLEYEAGPQIKKSGKALLRYPDYIPTTNYFRIESMFETGKKLRENPAYIEATNR